LDHILVIGASNGIGAEVSVQAEAAGYRVRAMSRSGGVPIGAGEGCTAFPGDARNAADVAAALAGIDAVVMTLGLPVSVSRVVEPVRLFSDATRVLIDQMEQLGVERLVAVTGFGAGDSYSALGPVQRLAFDAALGQAYDDKSVQELLIRRSALNWLIIRPGILTDRPAGAYRVLCEPAQWRPGFVARRDVAQFIVDRIRQDRFDRQAPVIVR